MDTILATVLESERKVLLSLCIPFILWTWSDARNRREFAKKSVIVTVYALLLRLPEDCRPEMRIAQKFRVMSMVFFLCFDTVCIFTTALMIVGHTHNLNNPRQTEAIEETFAVQQPNGRVDLARSAPGANVRNGNRRSCS